MFVANFLDSDSEVLEVGCGTGYGTHLLAARAKSLVGFDPDLNLESDPNVSQLLKFSSSCQGNQTETNPPFFANSRENIPRKDYSHIIALEVIEHISQLEAAEFLEWIKSFGNEGTAYFISTPRALPFAERTKNRQQHHLHEYTHVEFKEILEKFFKHVFIFQQNDLHISVQNPKNAWNFIAICVD
jgi:cyclopropane fatty-acyl-phospholipid synthase-like methyltransferase